MGLKDVFLKKEKPKELTWQQRTEIKYLYDTGKYGIKVLAKIYGVSKKEILLVIRGQVDGDKKYRKNKVYAKTQKGFPKN